LEKLLEVGKIYEQEKKQAKEISGSENVNMIRKRKIETGTKISEKECYRCGDRYVPGHQKSCPALEKQP